MTRRAIIITNPGKLGEENYCQGVYRDAENYKAFFKEAYGGYWYDSEIVVRDKSSARLLQNDLASLNSSGVESSIIIFCGHGFYSSISRSNLLHLNDDELFDSDHLRTDANKRIIILDCCRKVHHEYLGESIQKSRAYTELKARQQKLNALECRKYYDKKLEECGKQLIVLHSCDINESSGDSSSFGGFYSSSLLLSSEEWARDQLRTIDLSKSYLSLSITGAHTSSVSRVKVLSGGLQNPQIEKPKSTEGLPFVIVA